MKKVKNSPVWVIATSDGYIESFPTFLSARDHAKEYLDENETVDDVYVFEVVAAHRVAFPEEPQPEIYQIGLEELP